MGKFFLSVLTIAVSTGLSGYFLMGCGSSKTNVQSSVTMQAVDLETGQPLEGVTLTVAGVDLSQTNAAGSSNLTNINRNASNLVVELHKTGYTSRVLTLFPSNLLSSWTTANPPTVMVQMAPAELSTTITLPTAGQPNVVVTLNHLATQSSLTIGADALVTSNGNIAMGNVNVQMTFYDANSTAIWPDMYVADANRDLTNLISYGMTDIVIWQDGQRLQVAPGKSLTWQVVEPADVQAQLTQVGNANQPGLYFLDPMTGLWTSYGSLTYDPNQGIFVATLPHLSHINLDAEGDRVSQYGTCFTGQVFNQCGQAVGNMNLPIVFVGNRATYSWLFMEYRNAVTDSNGRYCLNMPLHDAPPYRNKLIIDRQVSVFAYANNAQPQSTCTLSPAVNQALNFNDRCFNNPNDALVSQSIVYESTQCSSWLYKNFNKFYNPSCGPDFYTSALPCVQCSQPNDLTMFPCRANGTCPAQEASVDIYRNCSQVKLSVISDTNQCNTVSKLVINDSNIQSCDHSHCTPKAQGAACVTTGDCCNSLYACYDQQCVPISDVPF